MSPENLTAVIAGLEERGPVDAGEDVASLSYAELLDQVPAFQLPVAELVGENPSPALVASAVELILEGLHLAKRLNKDAVGGRAQYRARS